MPAFKVWSDISVDGGSIVCLRVMIFVLCFICVGQNYCYSQNNDLTIHSNTFVSERTSSVYHRSFCTKLMTHPTPISYVQCKKHQFRPCSVCCDKKLISRLDSAYVTYASDQIRLVKQKQRERIQQQQMIAEQRKRQEEERARKKEARRREIAKQREIEEIRWEGHRSDIQNIEDHFEQFSVDLTVVDYSGFNANHRLFKAEKMILGSLNFPVQKLKVKFGSTVRCLDRTYVYRTSENDPIMCLSQNLNIEPKVIVTGRRFDNIRVPVVFEGGDVDVTISGFNLRKSGDYLYTSLTFKNNTKNFISLKDLYITIDGVVCRAFTEELVLSENISVPPRTSMTKRVVLKSVESNPMLNSVLTNLKRTWTKDQLEQRDLSISVSARYDKYGRNDDLSPFHSERLIPYLNLFNI